MYIISDYEEQWPLQEELYPIKKIIWSVNILSFNFIREISIQKVPKYDYFAKTLTHSWKALQYNYYDLID